MNWEYMGSLERGKEEISQVFKTYAYKYNTIYYIQYTNPEEGQNDIVLFLKVGGGINTVKTIIPIMYC